MVSGTVFNDILLWCVDEGDSHSPTENSVAVAEKRAKVRLSLSGHEVCFVLCTELQFGTVSYSTHPCIAVYYRV